MSHSEFRLHRLSHRCSNALFVAIGKVRHVCSNGGTIANFNRRIWCLTVANTIDPVRHVVLVWCRAGQRGTVTAVGPFWKVPDALFCLVGHHVIGSGGMLDGTVASQQTLP